MEFMTVKQAAEQWYNSEPSGFIVTKLCPLFNDNPHFQAYTLTRYSYTVRIRLSVTLSLILPRFAIKCTFD